LGVAHAVYAEMPWQIDGRQWHTTVRRDRRGRPVQWDAAVLQWLVDTVEKMSGLEAADWNDRARVEIKAPGSPTPWFMHVLTGGRDLLQILLRVPARCFDDRSLARRLRIKTLDERTDLPIYGQWQRVRVRSAGRDFDIIRIDVRDFVDVEKGTFKRFLAEAAHAYLAKVDELAADPVKGQPWKVDGRKWHLSQQSINPRHRILWKPAALLELMGRINKLDSDVDYDWNGKIGITVRRRNSATALGKIITNHPDGLECCFRVPRNRFTPLQIDQLGLAPRIQPVCDHDLVVFRLRSLADNDAKQLSTVLAAARPDHPGGESA